MIKFAIIGFGNIGKRHAAHINSHPDCILSAVCDHNPDVLASITDKTISCFTEIDELLAHADADVLCICTPNYLHASHTVSALQAGKHAVVEKPMALSTVECDEMMAAAEKNGKLIFAVKQNRYNPPVQAVKGLIEQGALGQVLMIQVNCFWNRNDAYYRQSPWRGTKKMDGGCLFTQFSHFVDILYYLNGDITDCTGQLANYMHQDNTEFEDTGSFVMTAANGALINFNFSTCSYEKNMEGAITIFGTQGTVKIGGQYLNTIEYQCINGASLPQINIQAKENDYGLYKGSMSNHDKVIDNVVNVLLHNEKIMTGAAEGRSVVRIIEKMYAGCASLLSSDPSGNKSLSKQKY